MRFLLQFGRLGGLQISDGIVSSKTHQRQLTDTTIQLLCSSGQLAFIIYRRSQKEREVRWEFDVQVYSKTKMFL